MGPKQQRGEKSHVRVVARCRPVNRKELENGGTTVVKFDPSNVGSVELTVDEQPQVFQFDRMFGPDSTQAEVFEDTVRPLIKDVLEGYNATVFAYGQTGTGKTHTMEGQIKVQGQEGIIPRSVADLFAGVEEADEHIEFTFKVSYVEIYMEKIRDLLDPNRVKNNLTVREDKANGIYIAGVTEEYVTSFEELLQVMQDGAFNRATAATGMNEGSSRSHSVFTITVGQKDLNNACAKSGKLVLIDLAGSEMVRKTNASGQQLEEAKTINKSLSALGQVINALTDTKQQHIPYRDSKLTRVLQDSLGGNSKTVLIVAISPSSYNANETLSTIRFGLRAKAIENKVTVNASRSVEELEGLLARAEKAIDVQAAHIVTLTGKLQGFIYIDNGGETSFESDADTTTSGAAASTATVTKTTPSDGEAAINPESSASSPSRGRSASLSANADQVALIESLQIDLNASIQDLEDERADSSRKDTELEQMSRILKEKERLLFEAGDLLQEARKHYESQRERCELLVREKTQVSAQMERTQEAMVEELEQIRFELKESLVTTDTLRSENKNLLAEVAELTGDAVAAREGSALSSNRKSSRVDAPPPPSRARATTVVPIRSAAEREVAMHEVLASFDTLCHAKHVAPANITALSEHIRQHYTRLEDEVIVMETRAVASETAHVETTKRAKELGVQRERLEADLKSRTESAVRSKLELEALTAQTLADSNLDENAKELMEKERVQNKSLQQRLEQLVAVHRQLLRKFASLELDASEVRQKLSLRDDRIRHLENAARGVSTNIRAQSERHVAELTNLREQIRLMKEEHLQRTDQQQHYMDLQLLSGRGGGGNDSDRRRSMRGGHNGEQSVSATTSAHAHAHKHKSIHGGRLSFISGGAGAAAAASADPVDRKQIKSMHGGLSSPEHHVQGGGAVPSASSFASMMARLGVGK